MIPAATHCRATVKCHSASSRSGRITNQGAENRNFVTLLLQAELFWRLAGRLRQELVVVVSATSPDTSRVITPLSERNLEMRLIVSSGSVASSWVVRIASAATFSGNPAFSA